MSSKKFIQSVKWPNSFLSMDADGFTEYKQHGGGKVNLAFYGDNWEYMEIVDQGNGKVAIKSIAFPHLYLRMYAGKGPAVVNCQYVPGALEEFTIAPASVDGGDYSGVSIESVKYPGNFLSFNGQPGDMSVGVAQSVRSWEVLKLQELTPQWAKESINNLIQEFGPNLQLYPGEKYQMCPVEWILNHSTLNGTSGINIHHPTAEQLPTTGGNKDNWLVMDTECQGGDMSNAKAYVRVNRPLTATYTDFQFWFCYAYNGHGSAYLEPVLPDINTDPLGTHWGDWEMCMIRIDNASWQWVGAYVTQHGGGIFYDPWQLNQFTKGPGHLLGPVVYSSKNGHAVWPSTGSNPQKFGKNIDWLTTVGGLNNWCATGGPLLACSQKYQVVSTSWQQSDFPTPAWVNYTGRWGPAKLPFYSKGELTSWIAKSVPEQTAEAFVTFLADLLGDDPNGPEGPAFKDAWKGDYS